ncbi:hypothetical protein JTB14_021104 [Gonioctena quinquepunctata]|nr:hypothetical protein JTB14_021104 [Gonioctena quinquepunctata]
MEHVPRHEEVETPSRNTKLSRSKDPLTEVSMSWSNRSGNRGEVNTKVFTNETMKAANHFPMNMTWISKENAKAGDELTISTSRRSPLSQKSTLHDNILRNRTSSDNMESQTCKSSRLKTMDILGNEITISIKKSKDYKNPYSQRLCSIWKNFQAMTRKFSITLVFKQTNC